MACVQSKPRSISAVFLVFAVVAITLTTTAAQVATRQRVMPFHPVNPNYTLIKRAIDAGAPGHAVSGAQPNVSAFAPVINVSFQGQGATLFSPSDANGAIGTTEYVETVNTSVGVYDRTGTLLSTNDQATWTGNANAAGDAEVIWSPTDQRFYASMLSFNILTGNPPYLLLFGFSKGPSPTAAPTDWCFYQSSFGGRYGSNLPDYPKLGQTADFFLMGVNTFHFSNGSFTYIGSDVAWVSKPSAGMITVCPDISSLKTGVKKGLKNADLTLAATPVPANQTDSSHVGWVVANEDPGAGTSTVLSLFRVSKNATTGNAIIAGKGKTITVSAYSVPPSAPQQGTSNTLDTLDARLTNCVSGIDPSHGKTAVGLWTQHTVAASAGGLGSEVRWYEINPATATLFQSGVVNNQNLYAFNGAVSPNRNGTTQQFGSNMVLGFNTSSSTTLPAAQMVSKIGANPQSGFVLVATSTAADNDFTCSPTCRWGDYSGASPDPASSTGNVWFSVMLNGSVGNPSWTTENWEATP